MRFYLETDYLNFGSVPHWFLALFRPPAPMDRSTPCSPTQPPSMCFPPTTVNTYWCVALPIFSSPHIWFPPPPWSLPSHSQYLFLPRSGSPHNFSPPPPGCKGETSGERVSPLHPVPPPPIRIPPPFCPLILITPRLGPPPFVFLLHHRHKVLQNAFISPPQRFQPPQTINTAPPQVQDPPPGWGGAQVRQQNPHPRFLQQPQQKEQTGK